MPSDIASPYVIAIAAPIGGGKSALTQALATAFGESFLLAFDDYETATQMSPVQLQAWLQSGADFAALEAPRLAEDFTALYQGNAIGRDGKTGSVKNHLLFEMPLGREWPATRDAIDLLIWVDVPLDLALARRIREVTTDILKQDAGNARRGLNWLNDYLDHYATVIHAVLDAQRQAVRPGADLILDGRRPIADLVVDVQEYLALRKSAA